jgi:hypothetical protein
MFIVDFQQKVFAPVFGASLYRGQFHFMPAQKNFEKSFARPEEQMS